MILDKDNRIKTKILNAIVEDPEIVLLLKEKYVDEEIWKFCIERDPTLFKKMKHPSEGLCKFACEVDGSNLKYIKNKFKYIKITGLLCFIAVKSNAKAILFVPSYLLNDELKEMAFDKDPTLMLEFKTVRKEYLMRVVIDRPSLIQYVRNPDESMICDILKKTPDICPFIYKWTKSMIDILMTYHPSYYALYKHNISNEDE